MNRPMPGGGSAHFNAAGRPTEVRRPGFVAHEVPGGGRRFVAERPGGRTVVAYGHGGYVQHGFAYHGHEYVHRTYYVNGRPYVRVYQPYMYRGVVVNVYSPAHFWAPGFYAYAYNPWPAPIVYSAWGWGGAPWFGVYGGFFTPYPVYATPALWLTDYMIAASLQEAYQARMDAANAAAAASANNFAQPMTTDMKQQIANEVQAQLQQQQAQAQLAAQNQTPPQASLPILDNRPHTLQVSASMNVTSLAGGDCAITEGDIVRFDGRQPPDGVNANASVVYSKAQDCPVSSMVAVPVDQLQEMSNHMLEVMEQGLTDFQKKQGTGGIPRLAPAMTTTTEAPFAGGIPPAEPNVQAELQQTSNEGNMALSGAAQVGADQSAAPSQATGGSDIALGQSMDQVITNLGQPQKKANLGAKTIFFYKDMKITFENGAVTDVQ